MRTATPSLKQADRRSLGGSAVYADSELERRRELGQFFTSPEVAEFIWDLLEVVDGGPFPPSARVIDPACGEGVFLRVARERGGLPARCLFGLDVDETLVPGWRRAPWLDGTTVLPRNGLLDELEMGIEEGTFDVVVGNPPFSGKGLRDLLRLLDDSASSQQDGRDLFGAICSNERPPSRPALLRQESVELDLVVRTLSRYSCWRLAPGLEPDVPDGEEEAPRELFSASVLCDRRRLTANDFAQAAELIAHWPHDRQLDASRSEVRDVIRRLAGTAIEVVFTERFVRLARPGGLIALIVPESIVASDRLALFRTWLLGEMDLLASVSLPPKTFKGVGANAKTSIVFGRRRMPNRATAPVMTPEDEGLIFMAAPQLDAPGFTSEGYLARVLADARREHEAFWPRRK